MQHINRINITIALLITIVVLSFYWYEWRPSQLVKTCHSWSIDQAKGIEGDREDVSYYYKKCLRENGIDK